MSHPHLPFIRHELPCRTCDDYGGHLAMGVAGSSPALRRATEDLADLTASMSRREDYVSMSRENERLRRQRDELQLALDEIRDEVTRLKQGAPATTTVPIPLAL